METVKRKLFDIPVYACTKEKYDDAVNDFYAEKMEVLDGHYRQKVQDIKCQAPKWEYNRRVGYICIYVNGRDVWFDVFMSSKKRIAISSNQQPQICKKQISRISVPIRGKMSNNEIAQNIKIMLNDVIKLHIKKGRYVNKEIFDNLVDVINYKEFLSND